MWGLRSGLCLAFALAFVGSVDAGHRKHCHGCRVRYAGCAAPIATCAAPATCAGQTCGCAAPGFHGTTWGFNDGHLAGLGGPGPSTYPTSGIIPAVIPGQELVW